MTRGALTPLFDAETPLPEGLLYRPDFLTREEEALLLDAIAALDFGEVRMHGVAARRRIVQFGWRYSFDSRGLEHGHELPPFLEPLRARVAALAAVEPAELSEVLVTEYRPGSTIGWHRDAPPFAIVAGVSLASACRFRLRKEAGDSWERTEIQLEPRSLYVLRGPARTLWQHSIPAVEALRYSITLRTLRSRAGGPTRRSTSNAT